MKQNNQHNNFFDVSWTSQELLTWVNAGLVPKELLENGRHVELANYISLNQQSLKNFYHQPPSDDDCLIALPPPDQLEKAYELQVVHKVTGKVIKVLERVEKLELCEGIDLKVKARELGAWRKTVAAVQKLTKDQIEIVKGTLFKAAKPLLSRKEIAEIVEEVRRDKSKPTKIRQGGHFVDSKLSHLDSDGEQITIIDKISAQVKKKIDGEKFSITKSYGIKLTPMEDKIINAIFNLLHEKSEHQNINDPNFYGGNVEGEIVPYGIEKQKSVHLRIKPAELYKAVIGATNYSGKDANNIKNALKQLESKKFLICYDRQRKIQKNGKLQTLTDRIETYQSLIKIISYIEGMTKEEVKRLDHGDETIREQKGELVLGLNPVLTDQIKEKYVEYPADINRRTVIASGGARHVTISVNALRDYLLREISANRFRPEINLETLIKKLQLTSYQKNNRKNLVEQRIEEAIKANKNLGLIIDVKEQTGAHGQKKIIFTLNKDFV